MITVAWCSISSVSRDTSAVVRSLSVITESIDIAVMDVGHTLINIWKDGEEKGLIFDKWKGGRT